MPIRVTFGLSDLKLTRTIRFDQFILTPVRLTDIRVDQEPGRHWEMTDQGVYIWRAPQPIRERDMNTRQHHLIERLHLLLSFARGGYVPVLRTLMHSRNGRLPWYTPGLQIRWEVARGFWTIYDTDDQLEAFMRQAFPRFKNPDGPRIDPLRGPIFTLIKACDEHAVDIQFLLAWMALETAVVSSNPHEFLMTRSKFEKHVRPHIKDALAIASASDPIIAKASGAMVNKIPELNRPPITDSILQFFEARGVPTNRAEIEGLKNKRDRITHGGTMEEVPGDLSDDIFEEWFTGYRDRLHEGTWRLINLTRAAILHTLTDEPLRSELRRGLLPDRYTKVG